jgi:hypothetical protein
LRFTETVILSIIHKRISEAVQTSKWPETPEVIDQFFFKVNGAARDTDNNKLHNEKTTKGKIYDRLKRKRIYQTSWKERNPWVETSALKRRLIIAEI